jgi:uncharacterized membrane protein HdeD (DUF308 family)
VLLRGVAAIAFGVLTWVLPGISLTALIFLFAIYALADGVLAIWTAIDGRELDESWWVLLLEGLLGVGIGVMTLAAPGVTALALLFYIAAWAIGVGLLEIIAAIRLRKVVEGEWALILRGLVSVALGILLMVRPGPGVLAALWLIATCAVVYGVLLVILSFEARAFGRRLAAL